WAAYAADRQAEDPASMLSLYRAAIRSRTEFGEGPLTWLPAPDRAARAAFGHTPLDPARRAAAARAGRAPAAAHAEAVARVWAG
ncbi:alpha-glucosidase, partial [Streptomyces sp. NPDC057654]